MEKKDYYEILGVGRGANADEVKRAYRKLAMKHHPDHNPGDAQAEKLFKEASEAYDVLRDEQKRARYDQFGHQAFAGGNSGFNNTEDIFSSFGDIFGDLFGFSRNANGARSGADLRYNLQVSFKEAATGIVKNLDIPMDVVCEECDGTGSEAGHSVETCSTCNGTGQVHQSQGFFRMAVPCARCGGRGQIITHPCKTCRGKGIVADVNTLEVTIPAGVDTGVRLRLRGKGEPGTNGGPAGDLHVVIYVEDDDIFEREGDDLLYTGEISFVEAILGTQKEIPTLNEPIPVDIPAGTQSGEVFRLRGLGMPVLGASGKHGDILLEIIVLIPKKITKPQEELLLEFQKLEEGRPLKKMKRWFNKAKDGVLKD